MRMAADEEATIFQMHARLMSLQLSPYCALVLLGMTAFDASWQFLSCFRDSASISFHNGQNIDAAILLFL